MRYSTTGLEINVLSIGAAVLSLFSYMAFAEPSVQPVKLTKAEIGGAIFEAPVSVATLESSELGPNPVIDAEVFLSSDRKLDAGMYRSGPTKFTVSEPYGVDEFMYFLDGGVTLTSRDGSVVKVVAGEAVTIPKEWTGVWESPAYTKIYVIYSPDALLPLKESSAND